MDCYKFVIEGRFKSMRDMYQKYTDEEKKKDESTSKITKCGRHIKTVFIWGSVAALMCLVMYGQYTTYVAMHGDPFGAKNQTEPVVPQPETFTNQEESEPQAKVNKEPVKKK